MPKGGEPKRWIVRPSPLPSLAKGALLTPPGLSSRYPCYCEGSGGDFTVLFGVGRCDPQARPAFRGRYSEDKFFSTLRLEGEAFLTTTIDRSIVPQSVPVSFSEPLSAISDSFAIPSKCSPSI